MGFHVRLGECTATGAAPPSSHSAATVVVLLLLPSKVIVSIPDFATPKTTGATQDLYTNGQQGMKDGILILQRT